MNILFVCSRNKWRSRTAETMYSNHGRHQFKSAGTEKSARIRINESQLKWADLIFVMEKKHKDRINDNFDLDLKSLNIIVLDIEDDYEYMDKELIAILKDSIGPYL